MAKTTVAETIKNITYNHLENNDGVLLGQCVTAVGWINGTVPDCKNIVELPMTDTAAAGFATGLAMVNRRPIFVVRFQDLLILNGSPLIYYAAKSKELHGVPAPIFIRAIGADRIGPVHSDIVHSLFAHYPGFIVISPMTPLEYKEAWEYYITHDDVVFISEHRDSFNNTEELDDIIYPDADITVFTISATRFEAIKASRLLYTENIKCNVVNIKWIKPMHPTIEECIDVICNTKNHLGIVLDADYTICGISESIAYQIMSKCDSTVIAIGTEDKSKCLKEELQNKYMDSLNICSKIKELLSNE